MSISVGILALLAVTSTQADAIPSPASGAYTPLTPARLLDSRSELGLDAGFGRTVNGGQTVGLQVTGRGGVPLTDVGAVALNVTVANPTGPGYVTVYATGRPLPLASNLNYVAGQTVANLVLAPVGADGKVNLTVAGHGVRLIADVQGYYTSGTPTTAGNYGTFAPSRLLDTRRGIGAPIAPVGNGQSLSLTVAGRGGVPATGVGAVALNVTATGSAGGGYITAYASGSALPKTSSINYVAGQSVPALVIAPVGADGKVNLRVSGAAVHLVADVQGYFLSG
ncbi:MAG: hypothetical protein JWO63_2084, partial [Frankiales bacterium]|nr:hypothetical protein [Frankiales bacterium]